MEISRRAFLQASAATAAAISLQGSALIKLQEVLAKEGGVSVVWIQAQNCTGCSVSLLNTVYYMTIDTLLVNTIDLNYHNTVMAAAGSTAQAAAEAARAAGGYVLVVEGAIPTGAMETACSIWPGMTALKAVQLYAQNAAYIMAVGACASFGGIPHAAPNPTGASSVSSVLPGKTVVNLPGCPAHPDWIVGTVAYIIQNGKAPTLDSDNRPVDYYGTTVHEKCYRLGTPVATALGQQNHCMMPLGCKGPMTHADCPGRGWNSAVAGGAGTNWCVLAGAPCQGCTESTFPDGMSPFYNL